MYGIFLDTETNGLNYLKHRILEISFVILDLRTFDEIATFDSIINQPDSVWEMSDPESLTINGFKKEYLAKGEAEELVSQKIINTFQELHIQRNKAIYICQNPSFDRTFFAQLVTPEKQEELQWPYHWLDLASMFYASYINLKGGFPMSIGLSKDKIASYFKLPPEEMPHKALNGVRHLIECYKKVVSMSLKING